MNQKFITAILLLFISILTYGQNTYSISGKTSDKQSNVLPGVNIYIPELQLGAFSDESGNYKLAGIQKGNYFIQFSYIGYETKLVQAILKDRDTIINIELHPSSFQTEEVVISGGRVSSQHENAIKIETIDINEIQTSGLPSLMESIALIPGVDVISKSNAVATPVIRGLSTSNILVLNNGLRMENYQFSENHPYLIDEFGIQQVEVIKGPASLLYGPDAIGGVLNFIKEKPANPGTILGDVNLNYFSNSQGLNGNLGLKGSGQKWYWGIRGGVKSHMDYLQGGGAFVPNSRFNQSSAQLFTGYRTKVGNFRLYYDYVAMKPGMTVDHVTEEITERGRKNEIWYQDLTNHLITSKNTFFLNRVKLEANLAYQYNHRKLNEEEDHPPFTQVDAKLNTLNYEIKTHITSSEKSNFILAIQGMAQSNKNQDAPSHVLPDYNLNDVAISGLVQHDFPSGVYLQVGLRFDNRFIDVPEQIKKGHEHGEEHEDEEEDEVLEKLDRQYSNISGSFGITYKLSEHFLIRGNLASAYRTPNIAELTQDGPHGARYEQGDRDLESQRNYEGDLSIHFHSNHVLLDLAGFYNHINRYIYLSPTSDTTDDGDIIYKYTQSDAYIYGTEVTMEFLVLKNLRIKGTYSYIRGQQQNGNNLPFIPQNKLKFDVKWSKRNLWRLDNFYIRAGTISAFDQNDPAPFETSSVGYTLLNAAIGLTVRFGNQEFMFDVTANNLLDKSYIDHLSTLKDLGYYNPGRNVMIGLKVPLQIKK